MTDETLRTGEFDPRWEWIRVQRFGMDDIWLRGPCNHLETEPVIGVTGEHAAQLCRTCDTQMPPAAP